MENQNTKRVAALRRGSGIAYAEFEGDRDVIVYLMPAD
jgi:hypothetical protein